jgi:metal-responsive CopG/Arc/MetJ family transcriptional regulator
MRAQTRGIQRFSVSLPARLVTVLDELARERGTTRSGLLAEWATRAERQRLETVMAEGYREMAEVNRHLAEQSLPAATEVVLRDD